MFLRDGVNPASGTRRDITASHPAPGGGCDFPVPTRGGGELAGVGRELLRFTTAWDAG